MVTEVQCGVWQQGHRLVKVAFNTPSPHALNCVALCSARGNQCARERAGAQQEKTADSSFS